MKNLIKTSVLFVVLIALFIEIDIVSLKSDPWMLFGKDIRSEKITQFFHLPVSFAFVSTLTIIVLALYIRQKQKDGEFALGSFVPVAAYFVFSGIAGNQRGIDGLIILSLVLGGIILLFFTNMIIGDQIVGKGDYTRIEINRFSAASFFLSCFVFLGIFFLLK